MKSNTGVNNAVELSESTETMQSPATMNSSDPPFWRKFMIVFVTSWITLSAYFSSTVLFSVVREVSTEFSTTSTTINIANAGVLLTLGMSNLVWGPVEIVGQVVI